MELFDRIIGKEFFNMVYQPFWFAILLSGLSMFFYLFARKIGWIDTLKIWKDFGKNSKEFQKIFILFFYVSLIIWWKLCNKNISNYPFSQLMVDLQTDILSTEFALNTFYNIVVFVFLILLSFWACCEKLIKNKTNIQILKNSLVISMGTSLCIEVLQGIFCLGFFRFIELFCNIIGGVAGGILYIGIKQVKRYLKRKRIRRLEKKLNKAYLFAVLLIFVVLLFYIVSDFEVATNFLRKYLEKECGENPTLEFLGTAVWTLTTILSAFILFYYGSLSTRNYGVSNRKIIAYTFGTMFIPFLVAFNAVVVGVMTIAYYISYCELFFLSAGYSCFLQVVLMYCCISVTSQLTAFKTIVRIEEKQFRMSTLQEENNIVFFVERIVEGDEIWSEKAKIIEHIWTIPFSQKYAIIDQNPRILHMQQYNNSKYLAAYAEKSLKNEMDVYSTLYQIMKNIDKKLLDTYVTMEHSYILRNYIAYGALFLAILSRDSLYNKWAFVEHLVNNVNETMRMRIIAELMMAVVYLQDSQQLIIEEKENILEIEKCFRNIKMDCDFNEFVNNTYKGGRSEEAYILNVVIESWLGMTSFSPIKKFSAIRKIEKVVYDSENTSNRAIRYLILYVLRRRN